MWCGVVLWQGVPWCAVTGVLWYAVQFGCTEWCAVMRRAVVWLLCCVALPVCAVRGVASLRHSHSIHSSVQFLCLFDLLVLVIKLSLGQSNMN